MVEDVVRAFGFLTLGSRMKRIGERLQAATQEIMGEMGVTLQPGQYPFVAALDRSGPLTVGALAEAVGITQPGVTRVVAQLAALDLVTIRHARKDRRQRIVSLTQKGRRVVEHGKAEVWPRIEGAVADLCASLSGPLLDQLAAIEDGLAEKPLRRRRPPSDRPGRPAGKRR